MVDGVGGAEFHSLLLLERCKICGEYTCNFAKMDNFGVCHRHTGGLNKCIVRTYGQKAHFGMF